MLLPYLRLLRVGTLFSPAADVVAGLCIAGFPWSAEAARAVVASVSVYAAGMVLNDHADRKIDARLRPERPIPSGQVGRNVALILGLGLLLAGVAISPWAEYHATLAVGVLLYDYALKQRVASGAVTMGLLRALNLLAGVAAVAHELPTDQGLRYAAVAYFLYIAAVTVLGTFEDEVTVSPRAVVSVQTIPPIVGVLGILALPDPWPAAGIAIALALAFSLRVRRIGTAWDRTAIRGSMTWLLVGTMFYTSLLCVASGRALEALAIAFAAIAARRISRLVSLT